MDALRGASVCVTGGAGFVGSNLVKRLHDEKCSRIVVVDNFLSSEQENLPTDPRLLVITGSIADDSVLNQVHDEFDYIFHLSTYHGNQSSIHDPLADHENNLFTTLKLCERVKGFKRLKKLVYSGAGCAVAEKTFDHATATTEDASVSLSMDSPYSISKLVGEMYLLYYFHQHQLPCVRARFQNVYGPGEVLGAGRWRGTPATIWRNVTPVFVWKALHSEPLPLDGQGEATRDFIFVSDIVEGLIRCALHGNAGEAYNLASGCETSIRVLAETINRLTGNVAGLVFQPLRNWDRSGKRFGTTEKSKREIGFTAQVHLEEGLAQTIDWTRTNYTFIQGCVDRHSHHLMASNVSG